MNFDINSIVSDIQSSVLDAAKDSILSQINVDQAKSAAIDQLKIAAGDALDFVKASLPRLERYFSLIIGGQITPSEFKSLLAGLLELAEMTGLTEAGLALIEIQKTRSSILNALTTVALGALSKINL